MSETMPARTDQIAAIGADDLVDRIAKEIGITNRPGNRVITIEDTPELAVAHLLDESVNRTRRKPRR